VRLAAHHRDRLVETADIRTAPVSIRTGAQGRKKLMLDSGVPLRNISRSAADAAVDELIEEQPAQTLVVVPNNPILLHQVAGNVLQAHAIKLGV